MKNKLTISDIAKAAGVSKTAVSFVLNNKEGISDQTRQKVLDVIKQTNYKPTMNSKRLFFQKSFTIAVVFDQNGYRFDNLFYLGIMSALLKRCTDYNYSLVYSEYSYVDGEVKLPENMLNKDVDGVVFLKDIPVALINTLKNLEIPYVIADAHAEYEALYTVNVDYQLAAYTAVNYLISRGHRRIGFVGNMQLPAFHSQIISGYQKALEKNGLPMEPAWCFEKVHDRKTTEQYLAPLLESRERPTAIFCMEDILAIELIRYLQKNKLCVPEDVSVIAIDDIILSNEIFPGLTTVAIDRDQLGSSAIDILMNLIDQKPTSSVSITATDIVVRESVKPITE